MYSPRDNRILKNIPNYIGIGFRRSGTSWLHKVINSHNEIGKPEDGGLHFFSNNYSLGIDWYKSNLELYENKKIIIEMSVSYSYPEFARISAERIRQFNREINIFMCLRNPIKRAYSDYLRSIRMSEISPNEDFYEIMKNKNIIYERSKYKNILRNYYNNFPKDNIKIFFYEDLREDPKLFLADFSKYVNLDYSFNDAHVRRTEYPGKTIRYRRLNWIIKGFKNLLDYLFKKIYLYKSWSKIKKRYLNLYEDILDKSYKELALSNHIFNQLLPEFIEDIEYIEEKTGRNLNSWKKNE